MSVHSPSAIKLYETCPRKFYHEKVARDVTPVFGEAAKKGIELHAEFERAAMGWGPWPDLLGMYDRYMEILRGKFSVLRAEKEMALDKDLKPCGFWDSKVWIRGKADLVLWSRDGNVMIVDWKTGKRRPWPFQNRFYALCALLGSEKVLRVTTCYEWVVHYERDIETWTRDDIPALAREVVGRAAEIDQDERWAPKPSGLCRGYCECVKCPAHPSYRQ